MSIRETSRTSDDAEDTGDTSPHVDDLDLVRTRLDRMCEWRLCACFDAHDSREWSRLIDRETELLAGHPGWDGQCRRPPGS